MEHYTLVLELTSPLAVSMRRQANVIPTHERVVASMVRGALAGLALRTGWAEGEQFQRAFVQGGIRSSSLLPFVVEKSQGLPDVEKSQKVPDVEILEAPQTLLSCKRVKEHGYEDALFASIHYALVAAAAGGKTVEEELRDRINAMEPTRQCPICKSVLKTAGGHFTYDWNGTYGPTGSLGKRLQTHVGLERERRGAAQGVLYSREVINESSDKKSVYVQATVSGDEALMTWCGTLLKKDTVLHIGNAISRGLGRCRVVRFQKALKRPPVKERVERFRDQFSARTGAGELLAGRFPISLTLDTPAFFVDPYLRPNTSPAGADLGQAYTQEEREVADVIGALTKVFQAARVYKHVAWNQLSGFPRTTEYGLEAGSVLVFTADALDAPSIRALEHIENRGVGINREAGFGRVTVCHPIHSEVHNFSQKQEEPA